MENFLLFQYQKDIFYVTKMRLRLVWFKRVEGITNGILKFIKIIEFQSS